MATVQEALQRIWNDPGFKKKLFANPKPVLAELGMKIPAGQDVQIWENAPHEMNFILPDKASVPPDFDLEAGNPVIGKVIKKAWKDASFKAKLLSNPKDAIADAAGIELPAALKVRVHEDTAKVKNLVLPVNPANEDLTDVDLEAIAGGLSKGTQLTIGCGSTAFALGVATLGTAALAASAASATGGAIASSQGKC